MSTSSDVVRRDRFASWWWWWAGVAVVVAVGLQLLVVSQGSERDRYDGLDCISLQRELFFVSRRGGDPGLIDYLEAELVARCHDKDLSTTTTSAP